MNSFFKKRDDSTVEVKVVEEINKTKKVSIGKILSFVPTFIIILSHIAVIISVALSFRYYDIYPSLFGSIVGIVICVLIIIDIIYFVGLNHKDKALKIVTCTMAILLLVGGTVGTYLLNSVNSTVDNVLSSGNDSYETVNGVFSFYTERNKYSKLEDLKGETVGYVNETSKGVSTIGLEILESNSIDCPSKEYQTLTDLLFALEKKEVDFAIFPNGYKQLFLADENNDYSELLDKITDFNEFTQNVKLESKSSKKNLAKDPFNVLLIGWSRIYEGSNIGLADAIIVVTVNPQTYTASMMSIARDSYVDIPCYGNAKDKINSGRSTSRACFIETVEQLVGEEMDFYIEADYGAIVAIVNAVGGVEIDNPVDFTLDGIFVPAGKYVAEGWQALEFCRERHAMPNGDFDRQQHQKEVIMGVMKNLIASKDIQMALNAMRMAGEYLTTDLSLSQLTSVFNMILNTKNYTGLDVFDLLDFQTMRMAGYASWHYSEDYGLPLWIYKLYNSSVKECIERIREVEKFSSTSDQKRSFIFSAADPYSRPLFFSTEFGEKEEHEVMPAFYPYLTNMTYAEALEWASQNNVSLTVDFILPGSDKYDQSLDGSIIDQSVRYGLLVSNNPSCTITVMGTGDNSSILPNFVGKSINKIVSWHDEYGYKYKINNWIMNDSKENKGIVVSQSIKSGKVMSDDDVLEVDVYDNYLDTSSLINKTESIKGSKYVDVIEWAKNNLFYGYTTNEEVGELLNYSCDDEKIKYSSRGCKFNFSDGKTTKTKNYSELTDDEKSIATIEWTDIDGEGSVGACSLLYINDSLSSVTCSGTRKKCGEHEERDSNGACQFKPYDEVSATCPFGEPIETSVDESTTIPYYVVSYTSMDRTVGSCKLYNPPAPQEAGGGGTGS